MKDAFRYGFRVPEGTIAQANGQTYVGGQVMSVYSADEFLTTLRGQSHLMPIQHGTNETLSREAVDREVEKEILLAQKAAYEQEERLKREAAQREADRRAAIETRLAELESAPSAEDTDHVIPDSQTDSGAVSTEEVPSTPSEGQDGSNESLDSSTTGSVGHEDGGLESSDADGEIGAEGELTDEQAPELDDDGEPMTEEVELNAIDLKANKDGLLEQCAALQIAVPEGATKAQLIELLKNYSAE